MSEEYLLQGIQSLCQEAIAARVFSGCVVGLRMPDRSLRVLPMGFDDYLVDGRGEHLEQVRPVVADSVFDLASVTKSIPIATLALQAILAGELDADVPVYTWLPELANGYREDVRLWHLLTHSLDYRFPLSSLKDCPPTDILQRIFSHPYGEAPGSSFSYGNAASLLLGILLERLRGESLPVQAHTRIFSPLGLVDMGWFPKERIAPERIVPTEICSWRGRLLRGEVHDESAYAMGRPVGSAGLFGTVPDLLRVLDMLLADGEFQGQRIMAPGVLKQLTHNALAHLAGQGTALGWELANPRFMGDHCGPACFGKTGFTGTSVVGNAQRGLGVVLLSNFTWPHREATVERIYAFRRRLHDWVFMHVQGG